MASTGTAILLLLSVLIAGTGLCSSSRVCFPLINSSSFLFLLMKLNLGAFFHRSMLSIWATRTATARMKFRCRITNCFLFSTVEGQFCSILPYKILFKIFLHMFFPLQQYGESKGLPCVQLCQWFQRLRCETD